MAIQVTRTPVLAAVFAGALIVLSYNVNNVGLAETDIDPLNHIAAQDEAVYSSTALHMVESGDWLTPMLLGRYAFYKPPLLYWAVGASARIFGPSLWALRLPSLLAAAAAATLLFVWMCRAGSLAGAIAGFLLLVSDRFVHMLARLALTDTLLMLWIVTAMACVYFDPKLDRRRSLWIFGAVVGLAIMTKGVAGFLPLMMLIGSRAGFRRFAQICGIGALVAAPWHAYQLIVHTRWFWSEYILTEHFAWLFAAPYQSTQENQILYYAKRLALLDPVLCVAVLLGLPAVVREKNRLLAAWVGVVLLAFAAFGYRNTSYLLLLIPPMCLIAGRAPFSIVFAMIAVTKLAALPYHADHALPAVDALRQYAALHRPNDLILVVPEDEYVSATIALPHVRYCYINPSPDPPPLPLDFRYLGISVTVPEFNNLPPVFANRLREYGLNSSDPIATVILAKAPEELRSLIAAHPEADFELPAAFLRYSDDRHFGWNGAPGRSFLLRERPGGAGTSLRRGSSDPELTQFAKPSPQIPSR